MTALPGESKPPWPQSVPDAVPREEPRSPYGNPPFYEVFGKRYYVLSSSADYVERGVASWYGPGFHKVMTSTQERYDMYGMTAAHKTLPLPAYVRVTNLQNGLSVVVRVNDRGPFVGNRIIDLSYTAAAKLDMLRDGTAMVEVRAVEPLRLGEAVVFAQASAPAQSSAPAQAPAPAADSNAPADSLSRAPAVAALAAVATAIVPSATAAPLATPGPAVTAASAAAPASAPLPPPAAALFVQAGAFANPANAERLAGRLRDGGYGNVFIRDDLIAGRHLYRVRIGPVRDVPEFDRIVATLEQAGVRDAHLALN